jgi:hypothetical protein
MTAMARSQEWRAPGKMKRLLRDRNRKYEGRRICLPVRRVRSGKPGKEWEFPFPFGLNAGERR